MIEFQRIEAPRLAMGGLSAETGSGLVVGLARNREDVEQAQRLRHAVFSTEFAAVFPNSPAGLDQDLFDPWCEHLIVRELGSGRVVGTYRILTPEKAREAGGYYSAGEFALSGLLRRHPDLVEFGRSCTHPDHRNGAAIMLLWAGLAEFLRRGGYRHVLGCASVSLRDGGLTARAVHEAVRAHLEDSTLPRVLPHNRLPIERLEARDAGRLPPLIKGYLKIGARVCGEPAWDPDFNTADFPMLLSVDSMTPRYRRHFGFDSILPAAMSRRLDSDLEQFERQPYLAPF